jgi:hypothetical protein
MKIEKFEIARVNLSGYGFPEFNILIIPEIQKDGTVVNNCILSQDGCGCYCHMFGLLESIEETAKIAYANIPDYLPDFVKMILNEDDE